MRIYLPRFKKKKHPDLEHLFDEFRKYKRSSQSSRNLKILLIRAPFIHIESGPPIGLAYVQDVLKKEGNKVLVWDLNLELNNYRGLGNYNRDFVIPNHHPAVAATFKKIDKYCKQVLDLDPDLVGFSLSYSTYKYGIEMAKRLHNHVRCIAGGPQASFNEKSLLDLGVFDTIVSGYGEEGAIEATSSKGIISKKLISSKEYSPDYTGIEIEKYNGLLPIVTTRGCPNNCSFCTQNHPYYYHSVETVIKQIQKYPNLKKIMFNDSNINVNSKRTENLFSELAKLEHKPEGHIFGAQIRKGFEKYVPKMAESGVKEVRLGIESGSSRERASMNKPKFDNELVVQFVKELTSYKITTWTQFIFCYPDQTDEDRKQTVDLMKRINRECNPNFVKHFWYKFVVHHGTEEFFNNKFGVEAQSPQFWENRIYNPEKIKILKQINSELIPENAKIFI